MNDDVLWLITARAGSKSIRDKNIKLLDSIPLINFRIKSALSIANKEDIWVSTNSEEYAEIAKKAGATVPFLRPENLAGDSASSNDVVLHAMEFAEKKGLNYSIIGLLEPTSPFVYFEDLKKAINILKNNHEAGGIVACKETRPNTFFIQDDAEYLEILSLRLENQTNLGRQEFGKQITPSGGFYISRCLDFKLKKSFYTPTTLAYILPDECTLEIDEPIDWDWAEFLVQKKLVDLNKIYRNDYINR